MNIHDPTKAFVCNVCWKAFEEKAKLVRHYRIHTGEKPFACKICDRKFTQKCHLDRHEATHSDVKPFKCPICPDGKSFKSKDGLKNHLKRIHFKPKFTCDYCDHKSHSRDGLNKHVKTHFKI